MNEKIKLLGAEKCGQAFLKGEFERNILKTDAELCCQ